MYDEDQSPEGSEMDDELASLLEPPSNTDAECSTPGTDSLDFSRTFSGLSTYSEGGRSSSDDALSLGWPPAPARSSSSSSAAAAHQQRSSPSMTKLATKHLAAGDDPQSSELELMKERFSKLLLGEDMSGGGKGVGTAVTISNSITNLYATVFGQCWRLEPLSPEKRSMWRREMECLLSVCDYIVEFFPTVHTLPNGASLEVMETSTRSDICMNLPALEKLDSMLLDILDSFKKTEFWYVEEERRNTAVAARRGAARRNDEKWWLPVPCVPAVGLPEKTRKELKQKRDCANQIHKAAMAINGSLLAEMQVPDSYLATLPKSGRASVGDSIYRSMFAGERFSPDRLLDLLEIASEHDALEVADCVEAAMYVWRRKACASGSKPSWESARAAAGMEGDKNVVLATRAESLLMCLKQRYPALSQTTLDTCKIQYNKDVGQAVLEGYSRVLESLAYKIVSWIDEVLYIDDSVKRF